MLEEAEFTYGELENPEVLVRRLKLGSAGQEESADGAANVGTPIVEETTLTNSKGEVSASGVEIPEGSASEPTGSVSEESRDAQFLVSIEEAASIAAVTFAVASKSDQCRKSGLRAGERDDIRFL
jgi:hypothetical protein